MKKKSLNILWFFWGLITSSCLGSERVALVLGNSQYKHLSELKNPSNDAPAIEAVLKDLGFKTTLLLDANEQNLRKGLKTFSDSSEGATIALLFYAGHGAQVNGDNFILPIDMEIPKRETDIQISGIKVDDIINSFHSQVKVIFLDACRDNPALIKSLAKGRGVGYRGGLAPAKGMPADESSTGLFIAYSTDAGNIALDGDEKNSPFTEALLRHIKKPVSIDDMFSLVTREVRLKTKNNQRPYKYASLEGVVCLSSDCDGDFVQGATGVSNNFSKSELTEKQDLEIAINVGTKDGLEAFLVKYPKSSNQKEVLNRLARLEKEAANKWVIFETLTGTGNPVFFKPSSIKNEKNRIVVETKWLRDEQNPVFAEDEKIQFLESDFVFDCKTKAYGIYESRSYDRDGKVLNNPRFGDPKYIELLERGKPGTISEILAGMVCKKENHHPLASGIVKDSSVWERVYTFEDKDMYYRKGKQQKRGKDSYVLIRNVYSNPRQLSSTPKEKEGLLFSDTKVKYEIVEDFINCREKTFRVGRSEGYDEKGNLIYLFNTGTLSQYDQIFTGDGPVRQLFHMVCSSVSDKKGKKHED